MTLIFGEEQSCPMTNMEGKEYRYVGDPEGFSGIIREMRRREQTGQEESYERTLAGLNDEDCDGRRMPDEFRRFGAVTWYPDTELRAIKTTVTNSDPETGTKSDERRYRELYHLAEAKFVMFTTEHIDLFQNMLFQWGGATDSWTNYYKITQACGMSTSQIEYIKKLMRYNVGLLRFGVSFTPDDQQRPRAQQLILPIPQRDG